jgi:single-stranded DNA-binding protein
MESLKTLENGNSFLAVSLAVKSEAIDKEGQPYQRTDYPQLTLWNEKAIATARDFGKGTLVEVTAIMQTRRYKAEDGNSWRYATDFLVQSIEQPSMPTAEAQPLKIPAEAQPIALVSGELYTAPASVAPQAKSSTQRTKSRSRTGRK